MKMSKEEKDKVEEEDEMMLKELKKQISLDRDHRKYLGGEAESRYVDEKIRKMLKKCSD